MDNPLALSSTYANIQVLADNKTSMNLEELKRKEEMRKVMSGDYEDYSEGDNEDN